MDTSILVASIAACSAIIAPSVSFYLTRQKERQARWRDEKLGQYRELLGAISDIVGQASHSQKERFALAANTTQLTGSDEVVVALHELLDEIS